MKIIVGLGNPGREYKDTRHNAGFMAVEELARRFPVERQDSKFDAIIGHIRIGTEKVLLVKPLTYMNLSGRAVQGIMRFYKLDLDELMVVYDDMDLPTGKLRIRPKGGTGGHKGMASISTHMGSQDFPRMRVGIGRPQYDTVDWVLGRFKGEEKEEIQAAVKKAADALETWVRDDINRAMNTYNE